jgi:chitinase
MAIALGPSAQAGVINITQGGTYTFTTGNPDPTLAAVSIQTTDMVTLKDCVIYSHGNGISADVPGVSLHLSHTTVSILPGGRKAVKIPNPNFLWVENCEIDGGWSGVNVMGDGSNAQTKAQITIGYNRFRNCYNAVHLNGIHLDPNISIQWNEVLSVPGSTDALSLYRSSGIPGAPILIENNYVHGVAPADFRDTTFTGAGIVTDGDTADPQLATSSVEIAYNQVVGCVYQGIALAFGTNLIAHDNVVVSAGINPYGAPYACAWIGIAIEGALQPAGWLTSVQLVHNIVGVNNRFLGANPRYDAVVWYPSLSSKYVEDTLSLHDGSITLADEQAQSVAWKAKLAANRVTVGP